MNKFLMPGIVAAVALTGLAFNQLAVRTATAPFAKTYGATLLTDAATIYHTLENTQGDDLWFPTATSTTVQVFYDETGGSASGTLTLQGTNQIDAASPRWADIYTIGTAWTADKDTLLTITPVFANYRIKMVQTGTATATLTTSWIVE